MRKKKKNFLRYFHLQDWHAAAAEITKQPLINLL